MKGYVLVRPMIARERNSLEEEVKKKKSVQENKKNGKKKKYDPFTKGR